MTVGTPVLLIIFNRPEKVQRVIEALRLVKPPIIMIAGDGPRFEEERALCEAARACIAAIDWPCSIVQDYAEHNLGCGVRVHTAVSWALGIYERVIVLEDDCIPHPSFFEFCEALLEYYAQDERVMHISGNNFRGGEAAGGAAYYFSKYMHAWGWATWRRAWRHFDWSIRAWPEAHSMGLIEVWFDSATERAFWTDIFDKVWKGAPDIWDYQWNFACWSQNGLAVLPRVNLVANIGSGPDATHTHELGPFFGMATESIGMITHQTIVQRNYFADRETFVRNYGGGGAPDAPLRTRLHSWALRHVPGLRVIEHRLRGQL